VTDVGIGRSMETLDISVFCLCLCCCIDTGHDMAYSGYFMV